MALEPLRSAQSSGLTEDTSLALPSDNTLSSGQRRVLNQVDTIKRSKSRRSKSCTLSTSLSPTSPPPQISTNFSDFETFKFSPAKANGRSFGATTSISAGYSKAQNYQRSRSLSTKTAGRRHFSSSGTWEQQISTLNRPRNPNGLKMSHSDSALAPPLAPAPSMKAAGQTTKSQNTIRVRGNRHSSNSMVNGSNFTNSQTGIFPPGYHMEENMSLIKTSKIEQTSAVNYAMSMSDITLKEAVDMLSHDEEHQQRCGATVIQHTTFNEDGAKAEVLQLEGIPVLVTLLRSPNPGVNQAAAGALRNLVFKNQGNKLEVQHCGGIAKALQLLQETDSTETQKQVTGLLWNLSSADELKTELMTTALPALTKNVVVPFTCLSDSNKHIDPSVFYYATGCLRNLSYGQKDERQQMRSCPKLIDSLMSYMQSCVAEENPDDKPVENCACILHNLTYQLEQESPESFESVYPLEAESKKSPIVGCFSPRSSKVQKEFLFDGTRAFPNDPSGVNWLCHPKAMDIYLALMDLSQNDATLEASCGALQNLTASGDRGSHAVSQILIKKFRSMFLLPCLVRSPNHNLQKITMSLLDNMSRFTERANLAKLALPELTNLLSSNEGATGSSDDIKAAACNTMRRLMPADIEVSKKVIDEDLLTLLNELSQKESFPKSSKAASLLLYSMWNDKNLQSIVKKLPGFNKAFFINEITTAVHQSAKNSCDKD
ncbi:plakophilin-1 [Odontesthes bonariensis]|uniref:plakophilin-1 n=1 Tax=Odontesthes bonariensis TaxID=219752 RepID=UPI003F585C31